VLYLCKASLLIIVGKRERIGDATSMHLTVGREENMVEQTLCSSALFSSDTDRKAS